MNPALLRVFLRLIETIGADFFSNRIEELWNKFRQRTPKSATQVNLYLVGPYQPLPEAYIHQYGTVYMLPTFKKTTGLSSFGGFDISMPIYNYDPIAKIVSSRFDIGGPHLIGMVRLLEQYMTVYRGGFMDTPVPVKQLQRGMHSYRIKESRSTYVLDKGRNPEHYVPEHRTGNRSTGRKLNRQIWKVLGQTRGQHRHL